LTRLANLQLERYRIIVHVEHVEYLLQHLIRLRDFVDMIALRLEWARSFFCELGHHQTRGRETRATCVHNEHNLVFGSIITYSPIKPYRVGVGHFKQDPTGNTRADAEVRHILMKSGVPKASDTPTEEKELR